MKKIIFIAVLAFTSFFASAQQDIRLNVYGSYVFDDGFDVHNDINNYFYGKVKGGFQWGGGIEFLPNDYGSVELLYLNKSSDVPATFKFGSVATPGQETTTTLNTTQNYIMLGFNGVKKAHSGKAEGYAGLLVGVNITDVNAPSKGSSSNTHFAWGARLGTNIWMSKKVGIKLQAQILSTSKATGGDTYWGYWGPVYLNTYTTLWQFGLGGGLVFKLGKG